MRERPTHNAILEHHGIPVMEGSGELKVAKPLAGSVSATLTITGTVLEYAILDATSLLLMDWTLYADGEVIKGKGYITKIEMIESQVFSLMLDCDGTITRKGL